MDGSTFLASLASTSSGGAAAAAKSPADIKASALVQFNSGILDSLPVQPGVKSITLIPSPSGESADDSTAAASSKVHTRNVVNFAWDHDYYPGQVVSVSPVGDADFLAYGIVAPGKSEGVVRVVQRKTEQRTLLKGMRGKIKDLAFAHTKNKVILGCVDEFSNIFVFSVSENPPDSSLSHELLLEVSADGKGDVTADSGDYQRFIWCPYLPEDGSEDEDEPDCPARQFVVTRGPVAEIWNLDMVTTQFGSRISRAQTKKDDFFGMMSIADHEEAISDAAFSPDGTALATASLDGQVKFFQCYLIGGAAEQNPPRCLHKWSPHGGKPVSFIHFLDNHKVHNPEVQFWKFAVTGANFNSELKLWSCETWSCLQTIRFQPPLEGRKAVFKVAMDLTSSFLVLSEINSKHVYIIHLSEGHEKAAVTSVSEFATPSSFLSLSVVDAGIQRVKDEHQNYEDSNRGSEEEYDILEMEDELIDNSKKLRKSEKEATVVEMMIVQPKSLQHCRIVFDDAARLHVVKRESVFEEEALQRDDLSVAAAKNIKLEPVSPMVEMATPSEVKPKLSRLSRDGSGGVDPLDTSDLEVAAQSITLMSPDSFSVRPPAAAVAAATNGKGAAAAAKQPTTLPPIKIKDEIVDADSFNAGDLSKVDEDKEARAARIITVTRGGQSSPSREVQDILCENEAIGGLGTEVIITEEDDYDDEDDDQADTEDDDEDVDDDDEDDEEVAADFKNLDNSAARRSLEQQRSHHQPPDASALSNPGEDWTTKKIKAEPLEVRPVAAAAAAGAPALGAAELGVLLHKMDELGRLVAGQRSEIQVLRKEIMEGRRSDRQKVEQLVRQAGQSTNSAIKQERKSVGEAVASSLGKTVSAKVEAGVASEMKRVAPAIVQSAMASVAHAIERDLQARAGRVDAQMKDAVARCMQSKALADSIAAAVGTGLQASMQASFRDALTGTLIPAFERAVQNMFVQLSTTFTRGMKEHEALIKRSADPVVRELQRVASASSKSTQSNSDLVSSIRKSVVEEVGNALEQHARSLAATPAHVEGSPGGAAAAAANAARNSFEENQQLVRSHLSRGDFDQAFQTALNANSLPLVVNTCEMANPSQIFTPPCLLSQHVILALIQQLGHNLGDHTETKHRFLEESIMNLDSQNPSTRHHMGAILGGLQKQLQAYIKEHPNNKFTKQMKMLLMATQSLLTTD